MAYTIKMPKLGMGMNEGTVLEWYVDVGDAVEEDEPLLEIEAEKTTAEIPAKETGVLRRILVDEGETVAPGTELGVVADLDADLSGLTETADTEPAESSTEPINPIAEADADPSDESGRVRASPRARQRAIDEAVDLREIDGSGPEGAVLAADVTAALESAHGVETDTSGSELRATPKAKRRARELGIDIGEVAGTGPQGAVTVADLETVGGPTETAGASEAVQDRRPLSGMRRTIADRLGSSYRNAVHVTVHRDVPVDEAIAATSVLDEHVEPPATITDVIILCLSRALAEHPEFNATFEDDTHILYNVQNINVAVDVEAGLVSPVVRDVTSRSLTGLVAERRAVTQRALDGTFDVDDLAGGTFTISNLGSLGVDSFTPVINPPQVAILGVDRIHETVQRQDDAFVTVSEIGFDLSFDHRVVDGADAARFLDDFAGYLQHPWPLMLEWAEPRSD